MDEAVEIQGHRRWVGTTSEGEAAIGRIAIWAAAVEDNLVRLCAFLINSTDPDVGYAATANMSASATIQLARKLLTDSKTVSSQDTAELLEMLTEARASLEQRNRILHATVGEIMIGDKTVFFQPASEAARGRSQPARSGRTRRDRCTAFQGVGRSLGIPQLLVPVSIDRRNHPPSNRRNVTVRSRPGSPSASVLLAW